MNGKNGGERDEAGGQSPDRDLSARLRSLESRLEQQRAAKAQAPAPRPAGPESVSPIGQAMRLSSEFIASVVVGGVLGWAFDAVAGTKPWGLMVFLLLGFATGIYNVMRSSGFIGRPDRKNGPEGT